ncbi:MAG: helix-turn-helix domain-containing protein [Kiloniellales bacterium]|jgi:excisionase family DNA binding protein|nr:helix-turn-helix domain-containing protein [Kiloniellales bacterium]
MRANRALTPAQVARRLQVSEGRVVRWLRAGHLRGLRCRGRWWTSTLALAAFLETRANRPAPMSLASDASGRVFAFRRGERA